MKRLTTLFLALVAACGAPQTPAPAPAPSGPAAASAKPAAPAEPDPWAGRTDLLTPPAIAPNAKVDLGEVERFTLPNGLEVILVPRHAVPVIDLTVAVKAGNAVEPLGQAGLADFTAAMLRKGTTKRSADKISETIDFVGGQLGANAGTDGTVVDCQARAKHLRVCLDLLADVVLHPTFPEKEMGEIQDQLRASVKQARDNPMTLARQHAANLYFGDDDPRGRSVSMKSIAAIDRQALQRFYETWYAPNNAILAVAGDFDARRMKAELKRAFGAWKRRDVPARKPHALPPAGKLAVRIVDKPDATQSNIAIMGPGIAHAAPDYYAVSLMNYTLGGGGFSSRLMKTVRSKGGKTYGVGSGFRAGRDAGPFAAGTFTRSSETAATIKLVLDEIARMRAGGPTREEMQAAKANMIGGYGLRLETASDVAGALTRAEMDGLDRDYVQKYPERLAAMTLEDLKRAAAAHLTPTALVVVGKAAEVKPILASAGFGSNDVVVYTAPVSPAERRQAAAAKQAATTVDPAQAQAGQKLLGQALAAKKGALLARVKDVTMRGHGTISMQGQKLPVTIEAYMIPGKAARQDIAFGPMKVVQAVSGDGGFVKRGEQVTPLPAPMAAEMRKGLWRDPDFIVLHASQPGAKVQRLPSTAEGKTKYDVLQVISPAGDVTRVLLDARTHLVARLEYTEDGKTTREELGGYRPVGGVPFAHERSVEGAGGQRVELKYDRIEINRGVAASMFEP